jgi:hypothetical protein
MPHLYGAIRIPLEVTAEAGSTVPGADPKGSDPLTHYIGLYLQAVANADAGAEYNSLSPGKKPVEFVITHDPERLGLNEKELPALYVFRDELRDHDQIGEDRRHEVTKLVALWIPRAVPTEKERTRSGFHFTKLSKTWDAACAVGRHPAFHVPGDTYYDAHPQIGPVVASGTSPPTVAVTGVPLDAATRIHIKITIAGAVGVAKFEWSADQGRHWNAELYTGSGIALGITGLTATFGVGTYSIDNLYRAYAWGYGSVLCRYAGFNRLHMAGYERSVIQIKPHVRGDGQPIPYFAYKATFDVTEACEIDAPETYDELESTSGTVTTNGLSSHSFFFPDP